MKYKLVREFYTNNGGVVEYYVPISLKQSAKILALNGYTNLKEIEKRLNKGDKLHLTYDCYISRKCSLEVDSHRKRKREERLKVQESAKAQACKE